MTTALADAMAFAESYLRGVHPGPAQYRAPSAPRPAGASAGHGEEGSFGGSDLERAPMAPSPSWPTKPLSMKGQHPASDPGFLPVLPEDEHKYPTTGSHSGLFPYQGFLHLHASHPDFLGRLDAGREHDLPALAGKFGSLAGGFDSSDKRTAFVTDLARYGSDLFRAHGLDPDRAEHGNPIYQIAARHANTMRDHLENHLGAVADDPGGDHAWRSRHLEDLYTTAHQNAGRDLKDEAMARQHTPDLHPDTPTEERHALAARRGAELSYRAAGGERPPVGYACHGIPLRFATEDEDDGPPPASSHDRALHKAHADELCEGLTRRVVRLLDHLEHVHGERSHSMPLAGIRAAVYAGHDKIRRAAAAYRGKEPEQYASRPGGGAAPATAHQTSVDTGDAGPAATSALTGASAPAPRPDTLDVPSVPAPRITPTTTGAAMSIPVPEFSAASATVKGGLLTERLAARRKAAADAVKVRQEAANFTDKPHPHRIAPHPETGQPVHKGSTDYPQAVNAEEDSLNDRFRGQVGKSHGAEHADRLGRADKEAVAGALAPLAEEGKKLESSWTPRPFGEKSEFSKYDQGYGDVVERQLKRQDLSPTLRQGLLDLKAHKGWARSAAGAETGVGAGDKTVAKDRAIYGQFNAGADLALLRLLERDDLPDRDREYIKKLVGDVDWSHEVLHALRTSRHGAEGVHLHDSDASARNLLTDWLVLHPDRNPFSSFKAAAEHHEIPFLGYFRAAVRNRAAGIAEEESGAVGRKGGLRDEHGNVTTKRMRTNVGRQDDDDKGAGESLDELAERAGNGGREVELGSRLEAPPDPEAQSLKVKLGPAWQEYLTRKAREYVVNNPEATPLSLFMSAKYASGDEQKRTFEDTEQAREHLKKIGHPVAPDPLAEKIRKWNAAGRRYGLSELARSSKEKGKTQPKTAAVLARLQGLVAAGELDAKDIAHLLKE